MNTSREGRFNMSVNGRRILCLAGSFAAQVTGLPLLWFADMYLTYCWAAICLTSTTVDLLRLCPIRFKALTPEDGFPPITRQRCRQCFCFWFLLVALQWLANAQARGVLIADALLLLGVVMSISCACVLERAETAIKHQSTENQE